MNHEVHLPQLEPIFNACTDILRAINTDQGIALALLATGILIGKWLWHRS